MLIEIALSTLLGIVLIFGYIIINELKSLRFDSKEIASRLEERILDSIARCQYELDGLRQLNEEHRHQLNDLGHALDQIQRLSHENRELLEDLRQLNHGYGEQFDRLRHQLGEIQQLNDVHRRRLNALSDFYSIKY